MRSIPKSWHRTTWLAKMPLILVLYPLTQLQASDERATQRIAEKFQVEVNRVRPSPAAGLYEIKFGAESVYVTADGRHVISGDILDSSTGKNLSEEQRRLSRAEILARLGEAVEPIIFAPAVRRKTITVFVDLDCGMCRKMHSDIQALLARGIEVRYVLYPVFGDESMAKARAVWCSRDRSASFTSVMQGRSPPPSVQCRESAVLTEHRNLGDAIKISGTPAIVDSEGRLLVGYQQPEMLDALLNK